MAFNTSFIVSLWVARPVLSPPFLLDPGHREGLTQPRFIGVYPMPRGWEKLRPCGRHRADATLDSHQGGQGPTCYVCQPTVRRLLGTEMQVCVSRLGVKGTLQKDFLRKEERGMTLT